MLSGEHELGVGEQEAVAAADDAQPLADDLVACAEARTSSLAWRR